jgi:hypothetical protein
MFAFGLDLVAIVTAFVVAPAIAGGFDSDSRVATFYALDIVGVPAVTICALVFALRCIKTAAGTPTKVMGVSAAVISGALTLMALGLSSILIHGVGD